MSPNDLDLQTAFVLVAAKIPDPPSGKNWFHDCVLSLFVIICVSCRCRDDVPKQEGFVHNLVQYTTSQWMEFFRMTPTTAQLLVETVGPFYADRSGLFFGVFVGSLMWV